MLGKFLCWIGRHEMVEYTMTESEYSKLIGHRCNRCLKVARGQEGLAELAQFYAELRKPLIVDEPWPIVDEPWPPSFIKIVEDSEVRH